MPIIKDSVPLLYPKENYPIVKYMDMLKFLSLIQKKAMFFCRQDKLEDEFEGQTAKRNYEWRIRSLRELNNSNFFTNKMTDEEVEQKVIEKYEFEKKLKAIRLINCWNKGSKESAALWKIYSDQGKGIMIKSSIERLSDAMIAENEIRLTEVHYLNFESDLMPDGNDFYLVCHKQDAYAYEDEVRLVHEIVQGRDYDWKNEENPFGKYFDVNIEKLIDEIVVGPYCPRWQYDIIKDVLVKYGLKKELKSSNLSGKN